jgi:hypothetical protein
MQIIEEVKSKIKSDGISVLTISKETGIPSPRIYKWLDEKANAKPRQADVAVLQNWLEGGKKKVLSGKLFDLYAIPPKDIVFLIAFLFRRVAQLDHEFSGLSEDEIFDEMVQKAQEFYEQEKQ